MGRRGRLALLVVAVAAPGPLVFLAWYCRGPARFEAAVDIRELTGAPPSRIEAVLGKPQRTARLPPYADYAHAWSASYRTHTPAIGVLVAYRPDPSSGDDVAGIVWVYFVPFLRRTAESPRECCQLVGLPETVADLGGRADGPWVAARPAEGIYLLMCCFGGSSTDIVAFATESDAEACPDLDPYSLFSRRVPGGE